MRRFIRFRRPIAPSPTPVTPILNYQPREEAESQDDEPDRPWYAPDFRWKTNRNTVIGFVGNLVGELLAWLIVLGGIVLAFAWFA